MAQRKGNCRRAFHPEIHQGHRAGIRDRQESSIRASRAACFMVVARCPVDRRRRGWTVEGADANNLWLHLPLHRILRLRKRIHARISGSRALSRSGNPSAEVAGESRLLRQARCGDRQRSNRGDSRTRNGRNCGTRHDASALTDLRGQPSVAGPGFATIFPSAPRT